MDKQEVEYIVIEMLGRHVMEYHKASKKKFKPPTLKEVQLYQKENPELSGINAEDFWKGYNDSNPPWIDTRGNPVRNWKLKFRTRCNYSNTPEVSVSDHKCSRSFCTEDAVFSGVDDTGLKYYLCEGHKPKGKQ